LNICKFYVKQSVSKNFTRNKKLLKNLQSTTFKTLRFIVKLDCAPMCPLYALKILANSDWNLIQPNSYLIFHLM